MQFCKMNTHYLEQWDKTSKTRQYPMQDDERYQATDPCQLYHDTGANVGDQMVVAEVVVAAPVLKLAVVIKDCRIGRPCYGDDGIHARPCGEKFVKYTVIYMYVIIIIFVLVSIIVPTQLNNIYVYTYCLSLELTKQIFFKFSAQSRKNTFDSMFWNISTRIRLILYITQF